jgi:hypothetical protein
VHRRIKRARGGEEATRKREGRGARGGTGEGQRGATMERMGRREVEGRPDRWVRPVSRRKREKREWAS